MAEPDALKLRERGEEVTGQPEMRGGPLVVRRADRVAEVVDGVVAAPQDPVVRGQPVVVGT